jgi:hypothetical protein
VSVERSVFSPPVTTRPYISTVNGAVAGGPRWHQQLRKPLPTLVVCADLCTQALRLLCICLQCTQLLHCLRCLALLCRDGLPQRCLRLRRRQG